jgi:hypothetical protein
MFTFFIFTIMVHSLKKKSVRKKNEDNDDDDDDSLDHFDEIPMTFDGGSGGENKLRDEENAMREKEIQKRIQGHRRKLLVNLFDCWRQGTAHSLRLKQLGIRLYKLIEKHPKQYASIALARWKQVDPNTKMKIKYTQIRDRQSSHIRRRMLAKKMRDCFAKWASFHTQVKQLQKKSQINREKEMFCRWETWRNKHLEMHSSLLRVVSAFTRRLLRRSLGEMKAFCLCCKMVLAMTNNERLMHDMAREMQQKIYEHQKQVFFDSS